MARILVTGMSGVGKTTVLNELRSRGHLTVDTDYDGWVLPNGTWDEHRMDQLLAEQPDLIISGTVENQARFYDRFHHIVLISAPLDVLIARVSRRTNNPYGQTPEQQAEIANYVETVEPLLRRGATLELDGQQPPTELANTIEHLIRSNRLAESQPGGLAAHLPRNRQLPPSISHLGGAASAKRIGRTSSSAT